MITMQTILDQLSGKEIVEALINTMAEEFQDFSAAQTRFYQAVTALQNEFDEQIMPSVQDLISAIEQQTASNLIFCGFLGLKANLDHFIDPVARNFLDADSEVYLRENTAHWLPEYARAQEVIDRFYSLLSPSQKEIYEDVVEYTSYLENTVPKFAHYYGYLLGNKILYRIIPGYHADLGVTMRYHARLEEYFGKRFDSAFLCGQCRKEVSDSQGC